MTPLADRIYALWDPDEQAERRKRKEAGAKVELLAEFRDDLITLAGRLGQPSLFEEAMRKDSPSLAIRALIDELNEAIDAVDDVEE